MRHRTVRVLLVLWSVLLMALGSSALLVPSPQQTVELHTPLIPDTVEVTAAAETPSLYGVWVPYFSLVGEEYTQATFERNFTQIVQTATEYGINALFVHVRPFSDALYPSQLYPWSHLLTGTQGEDPGYDPLSFMVETAHAAGMEFHAWVNPLRVKSAESTFALAENHPYYTLTPDYFMEWEGGIYWNPAYPYVRSLIAQGVQEIVEKYDVDGIHFDDYFYPTADPAPDAAAYAQYTESVTTPISQAEWRTANIKALVQQVYQAVKTTDETVVFGISPQGNLENDAAMGADVAAWCAVPGYVDYLCPQLYYSDASTTLGYAEALSQWQALPRHENLRLYVGLALYKVGSEADGGVWLDETEILLRQREQARAAACNGVVLYSIESFGNEKAAQAVALLSGGE